MPCIIFDTTIFISKIFFQIFWKFWSFFGNKIVIFWNILKNAVNVTEHMIICMESPDCLGNPEAKISRFLNFRSFLNS